MKLLTLLTLILCILPFANSQIGKRKPLIAETNTRYDLLRCIDGKPLRTNPPPRALVSCYKEAFELQMNFFYIDEDGDCETGESCARF